MGEAVFPALLGDFSEADFRHLIRFINGFLNALYFVACLKKREIQQSQELAHVQHTTRAIKSERCISQRQIVRPNAGVVTFVFCLVSSFAKLGMAQRTVHTLEIKRYTQASDGETT